MQIEVWLRTLELLFPARYSVWLLSSQERDFDVEVNQG